jgi:hypothetical protein
MPDPDLADEPDTIDKTVLHAREYAGEAMDFLVSILRDEDVSHGDRLKAAQHILEVAGCLSL